MCARENGRYDYIVIGSGPGGGTLAARLAESGKKVLVLEAGSDSLAMEGADPVTPEENRMPADYHVPVFHAFASENNAMKWDFYVDHYSERKDRDPKYSPDWAQVKEPPKDPDLGAGGRPDLAVGKDKKADGILYPRCGTLGGCSAHNAMITVYPHNDDWDYLETLTGDSSWSAENMRKYFQRLENCRYRPFHRLLSKIGINPTRHGFDGWLPTEFAVPIKALKKDEKLVRAVAEQAATAFETVGDEKQRIGWQILGRFDPNDWRLVRENSFGLRLPPLATFNHERFGTRERLLDVQRRHPENLHIELDALATKILFEGKRAVGVEYEKGKWLYRAHHNPSSAPSETRQVTADEVIVCGGAFNTPQLLMLSGIGPGDHLSEFGIDTLVDLPGVGTNLQDRYEVGVVNEMASEWEVLKDAKFAPGDPQYAEWEANRSGVYTTNGAVLAVIKRSLAERPLPDLFIFALLGLFRGYFPSYSAMFAKHLNYMTWAILKAHTNNTAGVVRLRSNDPRDTPYINFKYFDEGNDTSGADVKSVVEGVKFVRAMTEPLKEQGLIAKEQMPGDAIASDDEIAEWVKDRAWGHHASCSCPMGPRERNGVVDGNFKVHGVEGLRIVDASIFPKIPGFFIVSSIYMIGEKAADVILQDAK